MKRISMGMLAAILLAEGIALAFPLSVYSATVSSGTVKAKSGFVRTAASTGSAVSFCVASGDELAILGEEKGKDGKNWYRVSVGTSTGYIRSDLITKKDKKITVNDSLVKTTASNTGKTSQVQTQTIASVQPAVQQQAAVSQTAASTGSTGTIKGTYVRMRKNASQTSGVVTYLNTGDTVTIVAEGKAADGQTWLQVRCGDKTGFIRSDLVIKSQTSQSPAVSATSVTTTASATAASTATAQSSSDDQTKTIEPGQGTVKGTSVRIRSSAGITGNIVGTVNSGCELKLLGIEKATDRDWIKVETTYQGKPVSGYIARDYVTVTKEVKEITRTTTTQTILGSDQAVSYVNNEKAPDKEKKEGDTARTVSTNTGTGPGAASIKGVGVRIREAPVDGGIVCQLSSGHPLMIEKENTGSDNYTWYQVSFSYLGSERKGFVRSDLVTRTENTQETAPVGSAEFEESISQLPDSYKNALRALHAKHPAWKFETVDTGLKWSDALLAESSVGKNLVSKNSIASWKSTAPQAYNQSTNQWYTFDGGSWASASPELIAYYMDPRNFLNESGIYMFEKLDYSESQTTQSVSKMLTGTFMSGDFVDTDGETYNYAEIFRKVGEKTGTSPYLLAGRALQEQGVRGTSMSISGKAPGYENYFNYFHVGAYAYSGRSAVTNGLIYATGSDDEYARPWNSRIKSIYGGAKYLAEKYVSKGQNTLYFQKFNVVNHENTLYSHQYMSNIQAASSESSRLQLAYLGDDEVLRFRIPYYRDMPEMQCTKPVSDSNPNTYLASLSVSGGELSPAFSGVNEKYTVNVSSDCTSIEISAKAVCESSSVGGTGTHAISPGENTIYVGCKSQSGGIKVYTITVNR